MGGPDLLQRLHAAGLSITLLDGDQKILVRPKAKLTDELRNLIRARKPEIIGVLKRAKPGTRTSGNPLMTPEQGDECHSGGWHDAEIQTFTTRVMVFMRRGINPTAADDLAERLILRDRDSDDRVMCIECRHGTNARCPEGALLPLGTLSTCAAFKDGAT